VSVGNETYTLFGDAGKVYAWLRGVARGFDATRPVTMAELTYNIPFFDKRRRAAGEMDVISVNMYCGWYYGVPADIGPHLDRLHQMYPDKPIIISEFGADAAPGRKESDGVWKAERVGYGKTYSEEYQARIIGEYWKAARERPFVTGVSPGCSPIFSAPGFQTTRCLFTISRESSRQTGSPRRHMACFVHSTERSDSYAPDIRLQSLPGGTVSRLDPPVRIRSGNR
jgi:hypothetical protein